MHRYLTEKIAALAQLVERQFCKLNVVGSNPTGGSKVLSAGFYKPYSKIHIKLMNNTWLLFVKIQICRVSEAVKHDRL